MKRGTKELQSGPSFEREPDPPFERQPVSLRLRSGLRDKARAAALREGRSLTEQINILLERGLDADRRMEEMFGSYEGAAVARAVISAAEIAVARHNAEHSDGAWIHDAEAYAVASRAIVRALEMLAPAPEMVEAQAALEEARRRHTRTIEAEHALRDAPQARKGAA
jgi:hypothetical protein